MGKFRNKLTKLEKYWILYDVGNSAFIMLVSTIIPIYFKNIAQSNGVSAANSTAYWGYAISISTLIVAVLGPILGTLADTKGYKRPLFTLFLMLGVLGCASLSLPLSWIVFLAVFIVAKVGVSGSLIFYDAMLPDVTSDERMDLLSSLGYAWGYIGSCVPFVASLLLILSAEKLSITSSFATGIAFVLNAMWWLLITIPLLKNYKQLHYVEVKSNALSNAFKRLGRTFKDIKKEKEIFTFLLAFFFYIDGVYTIIEMATSYGKDVGISDNNLLFALLLTQVVAFPFAILFGKLSKKFKTENLIGFSIAGYFLIAIFALQLDKAWEFWFLAVCVAMFQGAIQALSRSYFAKIIPKEKSSEYFGFFDIFGKGASFTGTMLMGITTQLSGNSKTGVAFISLMFIVGFLIFKKASKMQKK
ncbi:MAG: MFS transporter [Sedimentibacter sp.]|uniref:MFS transporter n=1 Tax=Sedimentibacter sp. TaxID=1960295 RepID=UPI0029827EC6|nr:MFS transporter [Sedimentibacter sp.]MDW5299183.1 MFS transporter [Sedimentibacter sp.]